MHDAKTLAAPQIARYRLTGYDRGTEPAHDGGFVHYADHEAVVRTLCEGLMALEAESVEGAEIVGELKGRLSALQEEVGGLTRERDEARVALEPFAKAASLLDHLRSDDKVNISPRGAALSQRTELRGDDFFRARSALARTAGGKDAS